MRPQCAYFDKKPTKTVQPTPTDLTKRANISIEICEQSFSFERSSLPSRSIKNMRHSIFPFYCTRQNVQVLSTLFPQRHLLKAVLCNRAKSLSRCSLPSYLPKASVSFFLRLPKSNTIHSTLLHIRNPASLL